MMAVCLTAGRSSRDRESERGVAGEGRLVLSNCVYGSNTIISPCDSLIDSTQMESVRDTLCATSHSHYYI